MVTREMVEDFINRLDESGFSSTELEEGLWVVSPEDSDFEIVVNIAPPVVVMRVNVMKLPRDEKLRNEVLRRLLELNATELVHGSYGLEGDLIVLTDALELETLDFPEFQASIDSISLALASHLPALAKYGEA